MVNQLKQIIFCLVFSVFMMNALAEKLTLAENGVAQAVIVTPPGAGKVVSFAARELQFFLNRTTGAKFSIVDKVPADKAAIILGDCPESRAAGIDVSKLKRDAFRILRKGKQVFIAGRDDKNYELDDYVKMKKVPPVNGLGWHNYVIKPEYATLFGVYDFLERFAGIRFYYPGALGTYTPKAARLAVGEINLAETPAMEYRYSLGFGDRSHGKYKTWRMSDYPEIGISREDSNLWALRCRQSTFVLPKGHSVGMLRYYYRFYKDEAKRREDYFALQPDGKRYAESQFKTSLCYSNPEVIKQIVADAEVFFSGQKATKMVNAPWNAEWVPSRVQGDYFSLLPCDHFGSGCTCKRCKKLVGAKEHTLDPNLPGEAVTYPGLYSRILWDFFRAVASESAKKYPDKHFVTLAYGPYREMPENIDKLPDNLYVGLTAIPNGNGSDSPAMKRIVGDIKDWRKYTSSLWLWLYFINRPPYDGIPLPRLRGAGRFYNAIKDENVTGVFMECLVSQGFQAHLDVYLNHRLMWAPSLDAEKIVREYAENMYGPSADEVVKMLEFFEDKYLNGIVKSIPGRYSGAAYRDVIDWPEGRWPKQGINGLRKEVYTDAALEKLLKLAQEAKNKAESGSIEAKRLQLFIDRFVKPVFLKFNFKRTEAEKL